MSSKGGWPLLSFTSNAKGELHFHTPQSFAQLVRIWNKDLTLRPTYYELVENEKLKKMFDHLHNLYCRFLQARGGGSHYNKRYPYTPSDFIGLWVNSLVIMNGT
jgi:hypothetical protein